MLDGAKIGFSGVDVIWEEGFGVVVVWCWESSYVDDVKSVGFCSNDGIFIQTRLLLSVFFAHTIETCLNVVIKHKRITKVQDKRLRGGHVQRIYVGYEESWRIVYFERKREAQRG